MSKSLGNIITIRDALQKYDAKALRFLFATLHYRRTVRFDLSLLKRVSEDLKLIRGSLAKFREISVSRKRTVSDRRLLNVTFEAKRQFIKSMDDDFDVEAGAKCFVGLVMRLANFAKHYAQVNEKVAAKSMSTVQDMAEVFGIWPL
jgi:cysteinyl-tRNA synthetase